MSQFTALQERLDRGEVVILDGAIGTQLQEMGLPIYRTAWAATALHTHPATVQIMHEAYVKAGASRRRCWWRRGWISCWRNRPEATRTAGG